MESISSHLDTRLTERGISAMVRRWIRSFMEGRAASIKFDDIETEMAPQENAGLVQGSLLSSILFAFFNADLVDQPVETKGGGYHHTLTTTSAGELDHLLKRISTRSRKRTSCALKNRLEEQVHVS